MPSSHEVMDCSQPEAELCVSWCETPSVSPGCVIAVGELCVWKDLIQVSVNSGDVLQRDRSGMPGCLLICLLNLYRRVAKIVQRASSHLF